MNDHKRRPTIKDIASLAGVSIGTVDRALHNRRGIDPQTRQRILTIAEKIGYRKNRVASILTRKKPLIFAAVFPQKLHYFYDDVRQGFKEAIEALQDFKVYPQVYSVESLGQGEEDVLQKLLQEDIDALVLTPGHRSKLNPLINQFVEKNIPVVTVSTDAPESKRLTSVCVNPYQNGELAGELLAKIVTGHRVAIMVGSLEIEDHRQKVDGFTNTFLAMHPDGEVVAVVENHEKEELAAQNTEELLRKYPDLAGIYVATANSVAVCKVLAGQHTNHDIKLITTDLFEEMVDYLKKGVIQATLFQNPYRQGWEAVNILFQFLTEKRKPPTHHYLEPVVVMCSNLDFYYPQFKRRVLK